MDTPSCFLSITGSTPSPIWAWAYVSFIERMPVGTMCFPAVDSAPSIVSKVMFLLRQRFQVRWIAAMAKLASAFLGVMHVESSGDRTNNFLIGESMDSGFLSSHRVRCVPIGPDVPHPWPTCIRATRTVNFRPEVCNRIRDFRAASATTGAEAPHASAHIVQLRNKRSSTKGAATGGGNLVGHRNCPPNRTVKMSDRGRYAGVARYFRPPYYRTSHVNLGAI